MASLRKLLSDSVVYGLSSIVGRFLNYLLVPLYTYKIAAASGNYGAVTNLYAYTALLLVLLTFGMETTFFYFTSQSSEPRRRTFSTALGFVGGLSAAFLLAVVLLRQPLGAALGYAGHEGWVVAMACVVAMDAVQAILFARLRQEGRAWKFASLKLLFIFLNLGLNLLVFLVLPHWADRPWMQWYDEAGNVGYIFYINLICTFLVGFGFLHELRDFSLREVHRGLLKRMLAYAWPLVLLGLAGILNQVADKILLPFLLPEGEGLVELGKYGACVKIAMLMAILTQAFRYAYEPFVFGSSHDRDSRQSQAAATKYFVLFTLLAFLAVMAYIDVVRYLISPDYWEALPAVPIVMVAEILMGIYFNLSFWYKLSGRTWWGAVMSGIGCAVLVAVNVLFVPRYGYMACAWGGVAGYGVCVAMSYLLGQHYAPVPYDVRRIGLYFALAMVVYALMQWLSPEGTVGRIAVRTALLLVYIAAVAIGERALIQRIIRRITKR